VVESGKWKEVEFHESTAAAAAEDRKGKLEIVVTIFHLLSAVHLERPFVDDSYLIPCQYECY
jgi:hypothetical protein